MKRNSFLALLLVILLIIEIIPLNKNNYTYADVAVNFTGQTSTGTYNISTGEQLNLLASKVNSGTTYKDSVFILTNNIIYDSSIVNNYIPIGGRSDKTKFFAGTFDGQGYSIKGINIKHNLSEKGVDFYDQYIGIFGYTSGATIKNLGIEDSNIDGFKYVGGIVGYAYGNTLVENCFAKNVIIETYDIYGYSTGGGYSYDRGVESGNLVGVSYGVIRNCTNYSKIMAGEGEKRASGGGNGGIVGSNYGLVEFCYNYGDMHNLGKYMYHSKDSDGYNENPSRSNMGYNVAGIAGSNFSTINCCSNYANISGGGVRVAGIVGLNGYSSSSEYGTSYSGTIKNCSNTGNLRSSNVTGIVNLNDYGVVEECYNTGNITGTYATGIQALSGSNGRVSYCYNAGNVTGMEAGGIGADVHNVYNKHPISNSYNIGVVSNKGYENWSTTEDGDTIQHHWLAGIFYREDCYNTYFLDTSVPVDYSAKYPKHSRSVTQLKDSSFISIINNGENKFIPDTMGINNGYPIFKWQLQIQDIKINGNTTVERGGMVIINAEPSFTKLNNLKNSSILKNMSYESNIANEEYTGQSMQGTYNINNVEQLNLLSTKVNGGNNYSGSTFILNNDLFYDINKLNNFTPIGTKTNPFKGVFDGNKFAIHGINRSNLDSLGLFGYLDSAEIKNLTINKSKFENGYNGMGALAGVAKNSKLINCYVKEFYAEKASGNPTLYYIGGLIGYGENLTIDGCINYSTTYGPNTKVSVYLGGILGYGVNISLIDSSNSI